MSKRQQSDSDYEKSYAVKKHKPSIPKSFPDPHTYQEEVRHPWEREFENLSTEIRLKPNWTEKVNNKEILAKWESELNQHPWMWNRLKEELQYLASLKVPDAEPSSVDRVWLRDSAIPDDLHKKFIDLVAKRLETKPKEFHPNSNETIVDLVHPSLYCYVHGKTCVHEDANHSQLTTKEEWRTFLSGGSPAKNEMLNDSLDIIEKAKKIESGEVKKTQYEPVFEEDEDLDSRSVTLDPTILFARHVENDPYNSDEEAERINHDKKILSNHLASIYRWIPSDVTVDMFGKVKFTSYINGLHPFEEKEMYETIEEIMNFFVPLWSQVLADLSTDPPPHAVDRIDMTNRDYYEGIYKEQLDEEYDEAQEAANEDGGSGEPITFLNPLGKPVRTPPIELARSSLKVIVKIASIELTPEKPTYNGTWHIEGVPEEAIISTGIYYFAEENVADNFLYFRLAHNDPANTDMQCPMGLGFGSPMNRDAGKVQTKAGRLLCFPNIMQHCLKKVTLQDPSKPGYRKLLVFFLVDPNKEVLSAARVPPPCKEWAEKEDISTDNSCFLTLEQARENRANLMFTRKFYVVSQNENIFERECTFCEH